MMRLLRLCAAALLAALAVAACSSSNGSSGGPSSTTTAGGGGAASATITIKNFSFGSPLTAKPGETIKVTNEDSVAHNVTSDDGSSFKTADLQKGESATITAPSRPGTYKFSCTLHANMSGIGTLIVQG